ncbi:MAG TPA: Type 1 glutamine amidotransferase-like domain-containing protein [Candidatus Saccharimonadales bacterium]|nr:Type 1 glutamine amidotransferase-like domain-containing protein [Candidatus Saccharimonadales bacterium]
MKLYLTSYRIPDLQVLSDLVGKPAGKMRVALIPNAKDYYAYRARRVKIRLVADYLRSQGFKVSVVDLLERRSIPDLRATLEKYDLLWVMGGNTFCLREAMRKSGFDRIIHDVVEAGVVFAGESAGACIAGTDLHGVEFGDDPEFAEKVIWPALNLSPHVFVPHMDNPDFGRFSQQMVESRRDDPSLVLLNDNQAWVVNGDDEWKITAPGLPVES